MSLNNTIFEIPWRAYPAFVEPILKRKSYILKATQRIGKATTITAYAYIANQKVCIVFSFFNDQLAMVTVWFLEETDIEQSGLIEYLLDKYGAPDTDLDDDVRLLRWYSQTSDNYTVELCYWQGTLQYIDREICDNLREYESKKEKEREEKAKEEAKRNPFSDL